MPFTFCHPAIILPLTKSKKLSTSALIIGSTAPDFEFFIRFDLIKTVGHNFWAMFYFCLPITLLIYILFHTLIKTPLINNLPNSLYARFKIYQTNFSYKKSFSQWSFIVLSALIGVFSHLFWDSFTHRAGLFENYFSFLRAHYTVFGRDIILFVFLQFWSSVFGGLYMMYFVYKRPKQGHIQTSKYIKYWFMAFTMTLFIIVIRDCNTIQKLIATSISGGLIGLIFSSSIVRINSLIRIKSK